MRQRSAWCGGRVVTRCEGAIAGRLKPATSTGESTSRRPAAYQSIVWELLERVKRDLQCVFEELLAMVYNGNLHAGVQGFHVLHIALSASKQAGRRDEYKRKGVWRCTSLRAPTTHLLWHLTVAPSISSRKRRSDSSDVAAGGRKGQGRKGGAREAARPARKATDHCWRRERWRPPAAAP